MAVGHHQIEVAVVVEVGESSAPGEGPEGGGTDPAALRHVLEEAVAQAKIEGREVLGEVGGEQVEHAVAVHVAHGEAHAGLGGAVLVEPGARPRRDFLEDAVPLVAIEVVGVGVVGHVEIGAPVVAKVGGPHAEAEAQAAVRHSRLGGGVHEAPAALVPEEMVGCALETERAHRHLLETAPGEGALRVQHVLERALDVRGHVEIEITVAVRVEEGRARVPARRLHSGFLGHVLEAAVAEVAVQQVRAEVRDEQVGPAVAVVVGHRHPRSPLPLAVDPRLVGDVLEGAVGQTAVESVSAALGHARAFEAPAVDQVHVEAPVAIVVEESHARPRRVEEVVLVGPAREQHPGEAGLLRDVDEAEPGKGGRGGVERGRERAEDDQGRGEDGPAHLPGLSSSARTASTFFHSASSASALGARAI